MENQHQRGPGAVALWCLVLGGEFVSVTFGSPADGPSQGHGQAGPSGVPCPAFPAQNSHPQGFFSSGTVPVTSFLCVLARRGQREGNAPQGDPFRADLPSMGLTQQHLPPAAMLNPRALSGLLWNGENQRKRPQTEVGAVTT